jgi:hypothetical protein
LQDELRERHKIFHLFRGQKREGKVRIRAVLLASILTVCSTHSFSDSSGAILGRVLETANQSPVANATVTARNESSGFERTAVTAEDGTYFISSLLPGLYTIRVTHEVFQQNSISGYPVRLSAPAATAPAQIRLARFGAGQASTNVIPAPPRPVQKDSSVDESLLEVWVHWAVDAGIRSSNSPYSTQSSTREKYSLVESRQTRGPMPRQRMPELSSDQILVVATDEQGEQSGWTLIPDPRTIRAESPGPDGELSGQVLHLSVAEFLVPVPAGSAAALRFYQPFWTGKEFSLVLLGTLALP